MCWGGAGEVELEARSPLWPSELAKPDFPRKSKRGYPTPAPGASLPQCLLIAPMPLFLPFFSPLGGQHSKQADGGEVWDYRGEGKEFSIINNNNNASPVGTALTSLSSAFIPVISLDSRGAD